MLQALDEGAWQIVLLDYSIEDGGGALDSLAALAERDIDLPAILISGVIGEEEAADALRAGARDFVNKGNLTRLVPAVARELEQVEARRREREGAEALRQSEQRLRLALDAGGMGSWEWDLASDTAQLVAPARADVRARAGRVRRHVRGVHRARPSRRPRARAARASRTRSGTTRRRSSTARCGRTGRSAGTSASRSATRDEAGGAGEVMAGVTFDVTEREEAAQSLRESEERFRLIAEHAHDLIALLDVDGRFIYLSPSCESILGYPAGALLGKVSSDLAHPGRRVARAPARSARCGCARPTAAGCGSRD